MAKRMGRSRIGAVTVVQPRSCGLAICRFRWAARRFAARIPRVVGHPGDTPPAEGITRSCHRAGASGSRVGAHERARLRAAHLRRVDRTGDRDRAGAPAAASPGRRLTERPPTGRSGDSAGRAHRSASRDTSASCSSGAIRMPAPTDADRELLRLEPLWGADMVARIPGLEAVALIVRHTRERWDGARSSGRAGRRANPAGRTADRGGGGALRRRSRRAAHRREPRPAARRPDRRTTVRLSRPIGAIGPRGCCHPWRSGASRPVRVRGRSRHRAVAVRAPGAARGAAAGAPPAAGGARSES